MLNEHIIKLHGCNLLPATASLGPPWAELVRARLDMHPDPSTLLASLRPVVSDRLPRGRADDWVRPPRRPHLALELSNGMEFPCRRRSESDMHLRILPRIMAMAKCFVLRSAMLCSPGILFSGTIFLAHCSCIHRQLTSMWRTLATPCLSRMPLAAVASNSSLMPTSERMSLQRVLMPKPSQAPLTIRRVPTWINSWRSRPEFSSNSLCSGHRC